jgi:hypothetical protein
MPRSAPRHDRDAGGPAALLAAKVARFPGAEGRIPNFTGAEAAAERLRRLPVWTAADIDWADLTEDKIAAIPLLRALDAEQRDRVRDQAGQGRGTPTRD